MNNLFKHKELFQISYNKILNNIKEIYNNINIDIMKFLILLTVQQHQLQLKIFQVKEISQIVVLINVYKNYMEISNIKMQLDYYKVIYSNIFKFYQRIIQNYMKQIYNKDYLYIKKYFIKL